MSTEFYIRRDPDKILESLEEVKTSADLSQEQKEKLLKYEKLFFIREKILKEIKKMQKKLDVKETGITALDKEIMDFLADFESKTLKWGKLVYKVQEGGTKQSKTYRYKEFEAKAYELLAGLSEQALADLKAFKETIYNQATWDPYLDVEKKPEAPDKVAPDATPKKKYVASESIGILAESKFSLFKKFYSFLATRYEKWKKDLKFVEKYILTNLS